MNLGETLFAQVGILLVAAGSFHIMDRGLFRLRALVRD
jgi:hypothetical protein